MPLTITWVVALPLPAQGHFFTGASDAAVGVLFLVMIDDVAVWKGGHGGDEIRSLLCGSPDSGPSRSWSFGPRNKFGPSVSDQIVYLTDLTGERGHVVLFIYEPYLAVGAERTSKITNCLTISMWV